MKEKQFSIGTGDDKVLLVFNLNVMSEIQAVYGSITDWVDLLEDKPKLDDNGEPIQAISKDKKPLFTDKDGNITTIKKDNTPIYVMQRGGEPDMKAFIGGLSFMLNEGVEIENETSATKKPLYTERQVGRLITKWGTTAVSDAMKNAIATANDTGENSKNE